MRLPVAATCLMLFALPLAAQEPATPEVIAPEITSPLNTDTSPVTNPAADPATLAQLQAQLGQISGDLNRLRAEIMGSGPSGFQAAGGDTALDRLNAMQQAVTRLTGEVEKARNNTRQRLDEAAIKMQDFEFRLCEVSPDCNLGDYTLAGDGVIGNGTSNAAPALAASAEEIALLDRGRAALDAGNHEQAAQIFQELGRHHAGGPLTGLALYLLGEALSRQDQHDAAAEAWLSSFAAAPNGPDAARALLGVAGVLEQRGDFDAACLTLLDLTARLPASREATEARTRLDTLNCLQTPASDTPPVVDDPEGEADLYLPDAP